ncbi:SymE family type I addiction module toxin [Chitinophagaceae bacterium MMS25-I14]
MRTQTKKSATTVSPDTSIAASDREKASSSSSPNSVAVPSKLVVRRLKVYQRSYRKPLKEYAHVCQYGFLPEIRLNGKWLSKAGFTAGDNINVTILPETLVIRLAY